ncbi:MAG: phosphoribosylformylglycinamidine synthase subunit PurQ [Planctomycetes bacterium]|nr:phosphoribosylformylglycinamidine synthase subunit PurQ [Planctomycetota bacterium]
MAEPRVCVLRAPGTNCDVETAYAFSLCGAKAERVHLFRLLESPGRLRNYQVLCIPGGFSYGDDIGAGVIFSSQLRGHLSDAIHEFLQSDKLVLGICNGFQVLLKSGILPDGPVRWPPAPRSQAPATLTWNDNGKYTALWVTLECRTARNVFLRGIERLELPVAHAEGKLVVRDEAIVDRWEQRGQIALCYARRPFLALNAVQQKVAVGSGCVSEERGDAWRHEGERTDDEERASRAVLPYPHNPNGSVANIAGLSDPTGRVLGLMPHPERFIDATQHPRWTRLGHRGDGDGLKIFRNAVSYFE